VKHEGKLESSEDHSWPFQQVANLQEIRTPEK
jgi:hypothetical protein